MQLLILLGVGFSTGLSGAMIPGPLFLYTVSEAFRQGQRAGLKVVLGHLLLEAGFVTLVILGLRGWLSSALFQWIVAWVGGVGLIVMGGLILANLGHFTLARDADVEFRWGAVVGGAFFSLVSPGFLLWWATIGAAVLLQGALRGMPGVAMVAVGHAASDLVWYWFVAWSVERGQVYCTDRTYRLIMAAMATGLVVLGIGLPITHAVGAGG